MVLHAGSSFYTIIVFCLLCETFAVDTAADKNMTFKHGLLPTGAHDLDDRHSITQLYTDNFHRTGHGDESSTVDYNSTTMADLSNRTLSKMICGGLRRIKQRDARFKVICVPFLTVVGLTGNVMAFIVMGSPVYRRKSYSYYLRALAVFDSLTLLAEAVLMADDISLYLGAKGDGFLRYHTSLTCKLSNFLESVVILMSSWLIVAFTCDRYIAVCHPLQRARLCTDSRAKAIIVVFLLLIMASQSFRFHYIERLDRSKPCHAPESSRLEYFGIHYLWFSFFLRFALPFCIIAVCNGLIIFHVQRMHKIRQSEKGRKRRAHLAITTLVTVCLVFVVTLVPDAIICLVQYLRTDLATFCVLFKLDTPLQMLRLLNYSTNFILYGLTGRLFRTELRRVLSCRRRGASSPHSSKKVAVKVNFQAVPKKLPALPAGNGAVEKNRRTCPGKTACERKLFFGRVAHEYESGV